MVGGQLDDVAVTVVEQHFGVDNHIVARSLGLTFIDGMPHAEVGPSEVAFHHMHVFILFQNTVVDGQVGVGREILPDEFLFVGQAVGRAVVVDFAQHKGQHGLHAADEVLHV